jgi:hypothetical protein
MKSTISYTTTTKTSIAETFPDEGEGYTESSYIMSKHHKLNA